MLRDIIFQSYLNCLSGAAQVGAPKALYKLCSKQSHILFSKHTKPWLGNVSDLKNLRLKNNKHLRRLIVPLTGKVYAS